MHDGPAHASGGERGGMNELMNDAKSIAFAEYQPMAVFVLAAAIYFVMSYPLSLIARHLEARMSFGR